MVSVVELEILRGRETDTDLCLGYINSGRNKYADASGFNLDTQVLVFKVRLPKGAKPL